MHAAIDRVRGWFRRSANPSLPFEHELINCIESGDLGTFSQLLLDNEIDPHVLTRVSFTQQKQSLLIVAAYYDRPEFIKLLVVAYGCPIDFKAPVKVT